jgi:hypothetical protein
MVAVLAVQGVALANYYFNPMYAREDTRAAAQYLESEVGPRDMVLIVGNSNSLKYYSRGKLPFAGLGNVLRTNSPLAEYMQQISKGHDRLWLVEIRPWQKDPSGQAKAALDSTYNLIKQQHFPGVNIYCYHRFQ